MHAYILQYLTLQYIKEPGNEQMYQSKIQTTCQLVSNYFMYKIEI